MPCVQMGDGGFARRADVFGVCVCLGGVTWSLKGSQGSEERTCVGEPAVALELLIQTCLICRSLIIRKLALLLFNGPGVIA